METSNQSRPREFPMLKGPSITWEMAEEIYKVYSYCYGTGQSLKRIAQRGGFSYSEIPLFFEMYWTLLKREELNRGVAKNSQ